MMALSDIGQLKISTQRDVSVKMLSSLLTKLNLGVAITASLGISSVIGAEQPSIPEVQHGDSNG